jgi:hypothetical protein
VVKENDILVRTLAELREKVASLERSNELRNMDRKTFDKMQKYQDQVSGLLASKSTAKGSGKNGFILPHDYEDVTKRTSSYNKLSEFEQPSQNDLHNPASFHHDS